MRDLGEQTMPAEHLRPCGYQSQMACKCKTIKVDPRARNLTSDGRKHCWKSTNAWTAATHHPRVTKQNKNNLALLAHLYSRAAALKCENLGFVLQLRAGSPHIFKKNANTTRLRTVWKSMSYDRLWHKQIKTSGWRRAVGDTTQKALRNASAAV